MVVQIPITIPGRRDATNTRGTVLLNNIILGSGNDAIGLWGSSFCTAPGNHLGGFFADPSAGLAKIYLDPATSYNLIFCASPLDTVLDEGTNDKVFGGWPQTTASVETFTRKAAPGIATVRPEPMNRRPRPR